MKSLAYVNGNVEPASEATISVFDAGLNFGDGVFEGMRVYGGGVLFLDQHIKRLYTSARAVDISVPLSPERLVEDLLDWLRACDVSGEFHFRPIVTRGMRTPPRVDPRFTSTPGNVIFVGGSIQSMLDQRLRLVVSAFRRPPPEVFDSKIKSLSYIANCMSKNEAVRRGADDALVLDTHGRVAEASAANIFIVQDGELLTPRTTSCLGGITRKSILAVCGREGIPAREADLTVVDALGADELFLCGTGAEISPVVELEGKSVGSGSIGPLTRRVQSLYMSEVEKNCTPL